eukprot:scaffold101188_cov67-Phaeocystis_antarctica.AAC.6
MQRCVVRERESHEHDECEAERLRQRRVELGAARDALAARGHVEQREEKDEAEERGVKGRVDVRGERGGAIDRAARGAQDVGVGKVHPAIDVDVAVGEEGEAPEDLRQGDEGKDSHHWGEKAAPRSELIDVTLAHEVDVVGGVRLRRLQQR